jgi:hypothetical protein
MNTQVKSLENQGLSKDVVERIEYLNAQALLSKVR